MENEQIINKNKNIAFHKEKQRSKKLIDQFVLESGLIVYDYEQSSNISLLKVIIDNVVLNAIVNIEKSAYFIKANDLIVKLDVYQSLKEMNDLFLSNLTEDFLIDDLTRSYNFYISGGDIRDQDKVVYNEMIEKLYGTKDRKINIER
ncbi:hypothetical protein [Ezakiella peruensis]|uniref:hypothetical protein n=1 Tax=Ezakiella peruensis TaxID=1464038 RepID=UPI000C1B392F|nr:hypothetical protein [Ezakiella peruensis]